MATRHPERYRKLLLRLKEARREAGMSQVQVAEVLGVPQKFVSKIETGERRIDPLELEELAGLYGKPLQFFLE
jgi:transcriptional regulator with XRE-family HTH domain